MAKPGRPKGAPNKKTLVLMDILETMNCDPLRVLAQISRGDKIKSGVSIDGVTVEVDVLPTVDQRSAASKELLQYIYPKRKAIEHTGSLTFNHEQALDHLK